MRRTQYLYFREEYILITAIFLKLSHQVCDSIIHLIDVAVGRPPSSYLRGLWMVTHSYQLSGTPALGGGFRCTNKRAPDESDALYGIRRRPTLPGRVQPSTIGAEGLNFCVRNGNRWIPFAIATGNSNIFVSGYVP